MKELGITKGECENAEDFWRKYKGFKGKPGKVAQWYIRMSEAYANEKNSELLERYNEAIGVLKLAKEEINSHLNVTPRTHLIEKVEQTISKSKP